MRLLAVVALLAATHAVRAALPAPQPWCGTTSGQLGDLWEQTWLEVEALEEMPKAKAWTNAPGRVGMLLTKFAALHRASTRQSQQTLSHVREAQDSLSRLRPQIVGAANAAKASAFTQAVAEARLVLADLQREYSPESLRSGAADLTTVLLPGPRTLSVKVTAPRLAVNQPVQVDLRLLDASGAGVGSLQLVETHTRRLHALIIDPMLQDYHHEHPVTSGRPGDFTFAFTPRQAGDYLLWLDVMPVATGRNETPEAIIPGTVPISALAVPAQAPAWQAASEEWRFALKLDRPKATSRQAVNARLRVTDAQGEPCFVLEPVMGAFAHVVGFMDDRHTLIHVHSHGEPPHELTRSGPEVPFRFLAPKTGFLNLFVQVQIGGKVHLAKFAFPVE